MDQVFEVEKGFMNGLIDLALNCFGVGADGCVFRTPEINGQCLEVDIRFKMIVKE